MGLMVGTPTDILTSDDLPHCSTAHLTAGENSAGPDSMSETVVPGVGDRVLIAYNDEPSRQRTIAISANEHDPELGILGVDAPLAQVLLGAAENEEVEFITEQGPRTVTVLSIERTRDLATGPRHQHHPRFCHPGLWSVHSQLW